MLSNMEEKDTWFNDISYFAPGPSWQSFAAFDFACAAIQLVCTPTQCKTPGKQTCTRNLEIMDGNSMKCWTHWSYWCSNVLANWRKTISTSNFLARDWTEGLDLHPPQLGWWGCVWKWGSHQLIAYLKEQFDDKPLEAGTKHMRWHKHWVHYLQSQALNHTVMSSDFKSPKKQTRLWGISHVSIQVYCLWKHHPSVRKVMMQWFRVMFVICFFFSPVTWGSGCCAAASASALRLS